MFLFVLALLLLAAGVVLFGVASWFKKRQSAEAKRRAELLDAKKQSRGGSSSSYDDYDYDRMSRSSSLVKPSLFRYIGSGAIVLALICAFFSSFTTVPTKDIGVTTAFGAPTGYLTNGAHFIAPWESVNLMDGAIQTDTHNQGDKNGPGCVQVRIAHQIVACANMYVKWQVNEPAVDELYRNYREFSNVRDSLVDKNLQAVLNHVFESYDPLAVDADGNSSAPQLSVLSQEALKQMQTSVGDQISIQALNVTVLNYDPAAQKKIDALQAQVAQTRIAQQAIKTAENQAKANDTLAKSVSNNPEVLVSNCIDSLNEAISKGYQLPAGFSCWPGNGSSVVIPGTNGANGGK